MKKSLLLLSLFMFSVRADADLDRYLRSTSSRATLESPVLALIDGLAMGIDGQKIGFMLRVRRDLQKIQGVRSHEDHSISHEGIFEFDGKLYSIHGLATMEHLALENHDSEMVARLHTILGDARSYFLAKVKQFMSVARGSKRQMLLLIEEWCAKNKRAKSILLRWGGTKDGDEDRQFHADATSFIHFDEFCTDLIFFIEDLIRSCPKAFAQFKQMIEKQQENK